MDVDLFAALGQLLDMEPHPSPPAMQAVAFLVDGGTTTGGLLSMRCSTCREVKGIASFPPSCATWRRGACRSCRRQAAKDKPLVAKKLESARHRFGSVRSVTLHDIERLIQDAGLDTSNDLKRYCLSKRDLHCLTKDTSHTQGFQSEWGPPAHHDDVRRRATTMNHGPTCVNL